MKGVVIAGTHSGCGKTTVSLGIMAALRKKGLVVQPFKAGPDFIDAGLHRLAAGRVSRNLDLWMCGSEFVVSTFARHSEQADIAVVEGVMGLYDGEFSTARLAGALGLPAVLVVDAYGMAESAGAVVTGFAGFKIQNSKFKSEEANPQLAGVIFNRVASESHYARLKDSVRDVPVLGYLPREAPFEIPHRHLGLATAEEEPISRANIEKLADTVLQYIDVEKIVRTSGQNNGNTVYREGARSASSGQAPNAKETKQARIAVASDAAFCFYYEDSLDLLREAGAEIVRFSPLSDAAIPDADIVYLGGGYPELHARTLSLNSSMLRSVREWADAGRPLYAECGGLMYLSRGIRGFDGEFFFLAGVFPFATSMLSKPKLGYREITLSEDCILGHAGEKLRGHEFHYSEIREDEGHGAKGKGQVRIYSVKAATGNHAWSEGFKYKNTLASYIHVHFGSNRPVAAHFAHAVKGAFIG